MTLNRLKVYTVSWLLILLAYTYAVVDKGVLEALYETFEQGIFVVGLLLMAACA